MTERRLFTVAEAAERLRVSEREAWRLIERGELRSVVVGRRSRRVRDTDLDAYIDSLEGAT